MKVIDKAYVSRFIDDADETGNDNFELLSGALKYDAARATRIQIVSGYFGEEYVIELLSQIPTKKARSCCSVTLIFGYESSTEFLYGQVKVSELERRILGLGYKKLNLTIKLFRDNAPLHTKLYGFLLTTRPVWYVGSANLSKAIDGGRHELMLRITGKSVALDSYVNSLLDYEPQRLVGDNSEIVGLNRFFSAGSILFRPSRYRRFTYDGFAIDPDDRRELSKQLGRNTQVPHSDPSAEGFGFDLLSAIGVAAAKQDEKHAVKVRPYCVETAYGYWVPTAYTHVIKEKLAEGRKSEERRFRAIREALSIVSDERLRSEFSDYLEASKRFFTDIGINARPKSNILAAFQDFLNIRRTWLGDDEWINRNSSKLSLAEMPYIWSDVRASELFVTSFCDDVCSVLNSSDRKPKIYRIIKDRLQLGDNPVAEDVRAGLALARSSFWK